VFGRRADTARAAAHSCGSPELHSGADQARELARGCQPRRGAAYPVIHR